MPALTGETPIMASGTVTLTMIVNLKRFVRRNDSANGLGGFDFEHIRGTDTLADYLKELPARVKLPFVHDTDEHDRLEAAHTMRLFRGYVLSRFFLPTYRLDEEAFLANPHRLEEDEVLIETFPQWDYQITLTRNGFAIVRMIRHFEDVKLSYIAQQVQAVEQARDEASYQESRSNWRIAMDVTAAFVQAIDKHLILTDADGRRVYIRFDPAQRHGKLPLHDRYTTLTLTHVYREEHTLTPDEFLNDYGSFALGLMRLATVLRGGSARDMRRRRVIRPTDLFNLSPWETDACLVTNDALLVYAMPAADLDSIEGPQGHTRLDFWYGIARGVEWLANLRTEWQLIERQSTELLAAVSILTQRVTDGLLDDEDKRRINLMAQGVSEAFNILPELRYALVSSSISHATDAVIIFSHAMEQFGVHVIADHVNHNVAELNSFLSYYSSTQLQYETREQEESESRTGLTISIMLILLSLVSVPSLIKDASEIDWNLVRAEDPVQLAIVVIFAMLPFVLLFVTTAYAVRSLNRRR